MQNVHECNSYHTEDGDRSSNSCRLTLLKLTGTVYKYTVTQRLT